MRKFMATLSSYDASVIAKIWSGSLLTRSHKHTINPSETSVCECGLANQDLTHLMWNCPLFSVGYLSNLAWWQTLCGAAANALILPRGESLAFRKDWRRACKWALVVAARAMKEYKHMHGEHLEQSDSEQPYLEHEVGTIEANGHFLPPLTTPFAYCAKCYITRKMRDQHFIPIKPCLWSHNHPRLVGEYTVIQEHVVRIEMCAWKNGSLRPRMICQLCASEQWATASFKGPCSKRWG